MNISVEWVTPEKAEKYLEQNKVNRNISEQTVMKYADDMKKGNWQSNGQAISFYKNGFLADGQHRLSAIVKSGVTCEMVVVRDLDDSISVFDIGRGRSVLDSLLVEGMDRDIACTVFVAMARLDHYLKEGKTTISVSQTKSFLNDHEEALRELLPIKSMGHNNGISLKTAMYLLPMMYALESGEKSETIRDFAEVMNTGFYQKNSQTAAVVIRNDIILGKLPTQGGSGCRKIVVYAMENAICDFCRGKQRKRSYSKSINPVYSGGNK